MTTLCLHSDCLIATSPVTGQPGVQTIVQVLPRYDMDAEERRWQLEWERRNIED